MCSFKHHTRFDCIYKILLCWEFWIRSRKPAGPFFSRHFFWYTQHFHSEIFHINYEKPENFFFLLFSPPLFIPNHSFKTGVCKESVSTEGKMLHILLWANNINRKTSSSLHRLNYCRFMVPLSTLSLAILWLGKQSFIILI